MYTPDLNTISPIASEQDALEAADTVAELLADRAIERDRTRAFPALELRALARSGLLAIGVPTEYGGPGELRKTAIEVTRRLAVADPSVAQTYIVHLGLLESLRMSGTRQQRIRLFRSALTGVRLGNAVAERSTEHAYSRKTMLVDDPSRGLLLTGEKYYTTGARAAGYVAVVCHLPQGSEGTVYVPRGASGVEFVDDWDAFGQRGTYSGTVRFKETPVHADLVFSETPAGAGNLTGTYGQALHTAIDLAIAQAALDEGGTYIRDRARPWFQSGVESAVQEPHLLRSYGRLITLVRAASSLLSEATALLDESAGDTEVATNGDTAVAVSTAKAFTSEIAVQVCSDILELTGSSSTSAALGLDRHWRNARTHTLHDPLRWKYHHLGEQALTGLMPQGVTVF